MLVIFYLKYAPNQSVAWPAPVPTIILVISAIVAIGALLTLLDMLRFLGLVGYGFVAGAILAGVVTAVGAVLMLWGAWQEYQLSAPATSARVHSPGGPARTAVGTVRHGRRTRELTEARPHQGAARTDKPRPAAAVPGLIAGEARPGTMAACQRATRTPSSSTSIRPSARRSRSRPARCASWPAPGAARPG